MSQLSMMSSPNHTHYDDIYCASDDELTSLYEVERACILKWQELTQAKMAELPDRPLYDNLKLKEHNKRYWELIDSQMQHCYMPQNRINIIQRERARRGILAATVPTPTPTPLPSAEVQQIVFGILDTIINKPATRAIPPLITTLPTLVDLSDKAQLWNEHNSPETRIRASQVITALIEDKLITPDDKILIRDLLPLWRDLLRSNLPAQAIVQLTKSGDTLIVSPRQFNLSKVNKSETGERAFSDWVKVASGRDDPATATLLAHALVKAGVWQPNITLWIHDPHSTYLHYIQSDINALSITHEGDGVHVKKKIAVELATPVEVPDRIAESNERLLQFGRNLQESRRGNVSDFSTVGNIFNFSQG